MLGASIAGTIGGVRWEGTWLVLGGVRGRGMQWGGVGGGLNSWGEELWLYSKLLVRGMHGVTDRASLNWLFGVSCTVLVLSSGVGGGSDRISGEMIGSSV